MAMLSEKIGLCLDVGHWIVGGGDPVLAVAEYGHRISHVHVKDVSGDVLAKMISKEVETMGFAVDELKLFVPAGTGLLKVKELFIQLGGKPDFTDEELIFCALHHDLGKLGTKGKPFYILNPSDWHVKNQGKLFTSNDELDFMTHTDRTMFTLQHYGISVTEKEYFGMKLTDGLYDEDNTKYLKVYDAKKAIKSNLPHLMHWADHMSTVIESQDNNI